MTGAAFSPESSPGRYKGRHSLRGMPGAFPWVWVVPVLLFAVLVAGRRLNSINFIADETRTLVYTGARTFGPYSASQALEASHEVSGDQAFGWTILVNSWGKLAGWSTVAVRSLAFFPGLMALALFYRVGKTMAGHAVGLTASLLLLASYLPIQYFHTARVYTAVLCLAAIFLWSYWRLAFRPGPATRQGLAWLLLGGIGLVYSHYYSALMVPLLGLFHILFARKDRRWRQLSLTIILVALASLPELLFIRRGVEHNISSWGDSSMDLPETMLRLLQVMANGVILLPQFAGPLLLLLLPLSIRLLYVNRPRAGLNPTAAWYLATMTLAFFLLVMGVDHIVGALLWTRTRYLIALWPPLLILISIGIWRLGQSHRRLADWLLAALVVGGVTIILQAPFSMFYHEISVIHLADQALTSQAQEGDYLLILDEALPRDVDNRNYYLSVWEHPREIISAGTNIEQTLSALSAHSRVWLLSAGPDTPVEGALTGGMLRCQRPVERKGTVLTLYARNAADCG